MMDMMMCILHLHCVCIIISYFLQCVYSSFSMIMKNPYLHYLQYMIYMTIFKNSISYIKRSLYIYSRSFSNWLHYHPTWPPITSIIARYKSFFSYADYITITLQHPDATLATTNMQHFITQLEQRLTMKRICVSSNVRLLVVFH